MIAIRLGLRAGGFADGGAHPVVLAARFEAGKEPCPRAVPTFVCTVGLPCNDRLPRRLIVATDEHEGRIRTNLRENLVRFPSTRSDLGFTLADLVGRSLGALRRRDYAHEADRHR